MKFSYLNSAGVSQETIRKVVAELAPEINHIRTARAQTTSYIFAAQPDDQETLARITELVEQKQKLNPTLLLLVGIGGSSLGTLAVYEALASTIMPLICADTVDAALTQELYAAIEQELKQGGRVLMVVVSKSGKTTETLVNAALLIELLKKYSPETYHEDVVVITDENSPLWQLAAEKAYAQLAVPQTLGGRFSVFSAVGLFPLAMLGVDIRALCAGAAEATQLCVQATEDNSAAVSAVILHEQYGSGKHIHDTFVFAPYLAQLGAWYRQLMGESIGKRFDKQGVEVLVGMTPTVSVGSNDLHSVAQLYLAGPYDKVTTFVSCAQQSALKIPHNEFSALDTVGAGTTISAVQQAIFDGTRAAYQKDNRPFMSIELADYTPYEIGYFMQMKMFEIVYLGYLFDINVFDQPQVELYKKETRALLAQ